MAWYEQPPTLQQDKNAAVQMRKFWENRYSEYGHEWDPTGFFPGYYTGNHAGSLGRWYSAYLYTPEGEWVRVHAVVDDRSAHTTGAVAQTLEIWVVKFRPEFFVAAFRHPGSHQVRVAEIFKTMPASIQVAVDEALEKEAQRNPASWQEEQRPGKTYAQLEKDLRLLGCGVLGIFFSEGTLKSCVTTAPQVQMALLEMGHIVGGHGLGRPGHFDLSVLTSDRGWIHVDPTYMQFHCRYTSEAESDEVYLQDLNQLFSFFEAAGRDPLVVFELESMPPSIQPPFVTYAPPNSAWSKLYGSTWLSFFLKKARWAQQVLSGQEKRWMRSAPYVSGFRLWLGNR